MLPYQEQIVLKITDCRGRKFHQKSIGICSYESHFFVLLFFILSTPLTYSNPIIEAIQVWPYGIKVSARSNDSYADFFSNLAHVRGKSFIYFSAYLICCNIIRKLQILMCEILVQIRSSTVPKFSKNFSAIGVAAAVEIKIDSLYNFYN